MIGSNRIRQFMESTEGECGVLKKLLCKSVIDYGYRRREQDTGYEAGNRLRDQVVKSEEVSLEHTDHLESREPNNT